MIIKSIVAAFLAAVCIQSTVSAQDIAGKRAALLTNVMTSGWIAGYNAAIIKIFTANGVKVVNMVTPFDAALQSQQVDDAIAQKFDVILLHHINEVAILPALRRAKQAGVPVVLPVDKLPSGNDDLYLTLVGYDVAGSARDAADQLAEAAGGKSGKVAVIQGIPSQTLVSTLATAFKEELAIRRRKSRWQP